MIKNLALMGVPSSAGARRTGQELTPQWLRDAGLLDRFRSAGIEAIDLGDLPKVSYRPDALNPKQQNLPAVVDMLKLVEQSVDNAAANHTWPLVIGGDCTITLGVIAGLVKRFPNLGLIYFDGDVDMNTPDTTISGIFDGMVLAHILGGGAEELSRLGPRYPLLQEQDITLFGYSLEAGGIDPVEVERLRDSVMAKVPAVEVNGKPGHAAAQALRDLEGKVENILIHFDVDVVDFDDFPAADVPHKPGLSLDQARKALEIFLASPKVVGLVLTEFNASRDGDGRLARRLIDTLVSAITRR